MQSLLRASAVVLSLAGSPALTAGHAVTRHFCPRTFTLRQFDRAARVTYHGRDLPRRGAYGGLWRLERCIRPPATPRAALRLWGVEKRRWAHRRHPGWAIPAAVVMCESRGQNLGPNSAGASGYYQIIPGTWAAYGGLRYAPQAYLATADEQYVVAARIWAGGTGADQWVCRA